MKRKHWYFQYTEECPVCGRSSTVRERRYTEKPEDFQQRYHYEQIWDYCGL